MNLQYARIVPKCLKLIRGLKPGLPVKDCDRFKKIQHLMFFCRRYIISKVLMLT